jgi:UDP-glucuronate decarboxylase
VRDIAELILQQTGSRSKIERRPLPQDDPKRRQPVIARAIELLGWRPSVTLDKGLRATIDYFSLKIFTRQYLAVAATSPVRLHGNGRALRKRR